jgi:glutamate synthase domain-containing protein 2
MKITYTLLALALATTFFGYTSSSVSLLSLGVIFLLLAVIALFDVKQTKHTLWRNYPIIGRGRWFAEILRPKLLQYFIETDIDGTPFTREQRSVVYQRSKNEIDSTPFGTQHDLKKVGTEWVNHSIYPTKIADEPRVLIGGSRCKQPYSASILNISAMSYGALSPTAIKSLNQGSKLGGFYHNTGEGGISEYHLQGGDLCFQIGTGYFGAGKTINGVRYFDIDMFTKNATRPEVKMIELKLSQGAKPGHGGVLPAKKNTPEIANIRGVEPFIQIDSPPYHTSFNNSEGLILFIEKLRQLSGGKPVGFKLCVGNASELEDIFIAMNKLNICPDFITIDGSEGGTGAAPLEFTNNVGTPLIDALSIVDKLMIMYGKKNEIKIIASGKMIDAFDVLKALSMGASLVNSARGFMLSLGCIQARLCNTDECPVGVATQNKNKWNSLDPVRKSERVKNFHKNTVHSVMHLAGAMGLKTVHSINKKQVVRRVSSNEIKTFEQLY